MEDFFLVIEFKFVDFSLQKCGLQGAWLAKSGEHATRFQGREFKPQLGVKFT